ncbi:OmpP1/FadL family transporter [Microvirgula aerodenitrificans]|uniref:OmpP1/FadL family transporter n=1 Tax=Microvirgula aerodenitrificans TaxID=57480 RepID=UPI00131EF310|nr:outer membrane protein transport protein [Microvirgula aerodenitrificans]
MRLSINKPSFPSALSALALALAAGGASAAGFQLSEQSVTALGRAYAGAGIVGDDLSAAFYNPAGMTLNSGTSVQAGVVAVNVRPSFDGTENGRPVHGNGSGWAGIPNAYLVASPTDRLRLGLAITAPYGLKTDYGSRWAGADHGYKSSIVTIDINPSLAYRVNDWLSVGAGVSAQYARAKFSARAMNVVDTQVDADGWDYGYNAGVMLTPGANTRIGLSYRSKIDHHETGDAHVGKLGYGVHADVTVPESVELTGLQRLDDRWSVTGSVRWSNWSRLQSIDIHPDSNGLPISLPQNWGDSWYFSLGTDYRHDDQWTFRGGLAYETTPIKRAEDRTPIIPDSDRLWTSLGASWRLDAHSTLDFAYAHLFSVGDRASRHKVGGSTLDGEYSLAGDLFGLQYQYRF